MKNIIEMIAPCGMNCAVCASYLAKKNKLKEKGIKIPYCDGCRPRNKRCAYIMKRCLLLSEDKVKYCHECKDFPCNSLKTIDKRYRERYRMSMIENLIFIREKGIEKFLLSEKKKWQCPECGEIISCHNGLCFQCDLEKLYKMENKYRWE